MAEIPRVVEAELARLRADNARLLRLLKLTPQQAAPPGPAQAAYFEAPPGMVHDGSPPDAKVAFYAALFAARTDVYATRFDNPRTGKGGWVPAVRGEWRKGIATQINCATGAPVNTATLTDSAGGSGLQYDSSTGLYTYVWKTSKAWAGTCQQFNLTLTDGTSPSGERVPWRVYQDPAGHPFCLVVR